MAAAQSNEVYPTPPALVRLVNSRGASDKRFPLDSTNPAQPSFPPISPVVSCRMNSAAKLLVSMRRTQLDWQIGDLQTVARQNGIDWRHQKSSHCVFMRDDGRTLSVPAHRPIKPIYVRKFVELIDGA